MKTQMKYVEKLSDQIDIDLLCEEVLDIMKRVNDLYPNGGLHGHTQIVLTTKTGDPEDWFDGVGYHGAPHLFCNINSSLHDSYIEKLIQQYPDYNRWRIMQSNPRTTLSIHCDGQFNKRIHIPVISNKDAWLAFYEEKPTKDGSINVYHANLKPGSVYKVNTSGWHTAVNYAGNECRIHIIAEKNSKL